MKGTQEQLGCKHLTGKMRCLCVKCVQPQAQGVPGLELGYRALHAKLMKTCHYLLYKEWCTPTRSTTETVRLVAVQMNKGR